MITSTVQRWFAQAVRQYPWHSAGVVLLSILSSLADGLSISLLIPFLGVLFGEATTKAGELGPVRAALDVLTRTAGPGQELIVVSIAIVLLVAFRAVVLYLEGVIANWISGRISCDIRWQIHDNLLAVNYRYVSVNDNGRILNTLDNEAWRATGAITSVFGLITSLCMAVVLSGILLLISWKLTLVVVLLVGVISLATLPFSRRARVIGATSVVAAEDLSERAVELLDAMRVIRAFGRESQAQAAYHGASQRLFDLSMRTVRVGGAANATREILYGGMIVIVVAASLYFRVGGAVLVAYLALLHRLQPHVQAIDNARIELATLSGSVAAVSELLHLPRWDHGATGGQKLDAPKDAIRFERVSFAYSGKDDEERNALEDVSLEIPIGKVTAVVGWSGAGKSTLINLLFRFYDPDSGMISVDGVQLSRLDLAWWRTQLAIAGQDADLIGGNIRENIAYGREGATFEEIVSAAKRASVHDFIMTLPKGYDTRVGGRGVLLSGGQRQRIALARALIRESPILVLDEATNSLDSMTEAEVLHALEGLRGRMTVIVIAHRLSTTRGADFVVALAGGRVVEAGPPAELLGRNGLFAQMVHLQELAQLTRSAPPASGSSPTS